MYPFLGSLHVYLWIIHTLPRTNTNLLRSLGRGKLTFSMRRWSGSPSCKVFQTSVTLCAPTIRGFCFCRCLWCFFSSSSTERSWLSTPPVLDFNLIQTAKSDITHLLSQSLLTSFVCCHFLPFSLFLWVCSFLIL